MLPVQIAPAIEFWKPNFTKVESGALLTVAPAPAAKFTAPVFALMTLISVPAFIFAGSVTIIVLVEFAKKTLLWSLLVIEKLAVFKTGDCAVSVVEFNKDWKVQRLSPSADATE